MAIQTNDALNPCAADFTPNTSPITPSFQRFPSKDVNYTLDVPYYQGASIPPLPGYGEPGNTMGFPLQNGAGFPNGPCCEDVTIHPCDGIGPIVNPHPFSSNNFAYTSGVSITHGARIPPCNGFGQSVNPPLFSLQNVTPTSDLAYCQGAPTPQSNGFDQLANPLRQFYQTPQRNNSNPVHPSTPMAQRYYRSNSDICSGAPGVPNPQKRHHLYNNGHLSFAPIAPAAFGGVRRRPLNYQNISSNPVNNRLGQMIKDCQVPRTPESMLFGQSGLPTPETGSSDSFITDVIDSSDSIIRRKPPMLPRKDALKAEDLVPGAIVWLSNHEYWHEPIRCVQNHECIDPVKERDGHNHPVCILEVYQRPGSNDIGDVVCNVAIMTTLKGLGMRRYLQKLRSLGPDPSSEWFLKLTMPLSWVPQEHIQLKGGELKRAVQTEQRVEVQHHAELHQRGNNLLSLSRGSMQRRTYVRVHHIYAVPLKQLQACSRYAKKAYMVRLDEHSFRTVMQSLGLVAGSWEEDVQRSVASAPQRLREIRDREMARLYPTQHDATE
ncbi:hypothetical protein NHQ30_008432 [Ciborinia camelliae]|nr:hypothetical protein NHQ30_008432 [Ciborinia camelliae]